MDEILHVYDLHHIGSSSYMHITTYRSISRWYRWQWRHRRFCRLGACKREQIKWNIWVQSSMESNVITSSTHWFRWSFRRAFRLRWYWSCWWLWCSRYKRGNIKILDNSNPHITRQYFMLNQHQLSFFVLTTLLGVCEGLLDGDDVGLVDGCNMFSCVIRGVDILR